MICPGWEEGMSIMEINEQAVIRYSIQHRSPSLPITFPLVLFYDITQRGGR
jgi:hypothetical protein